MKIQIKLINSNKSHLILNMNQTVIVLLIQKYLKMQLVILNIICPDLFRKNKLEVIRNQSNMDHGRGRDHFLSFQDIIIAKIEN